MDAFIPVSGSSGPWGTEIFRHSRHRHFSPARRFRLSRSEESVSLSLTYSMQKRPLTAEQLEELNGHLRRGRKIAAIKCYREFTGCSLVEAQRAIDDGAFSSPESGAASRPEVESPEGEIRRFLAQGRKIEAVKRYKLFHGVSLKEAKDAVERLEPERRTTRETHPALEEPRGTKSGCGSAVIAVGVVCSLIYWLT